MIPYQANVEEQLMDDAVMMLVRAALWALSLLAATVLAGMGASWIADWWTNWRWQKRLDSEKERRDNARPDV